MPDDLPASVRSVVDGPGFSGVRAGGQYTQTNSGWMERAGYLNDLLSNSHEDFEGEPGEDAPSSSEVQEALNRFLDSSEVDWTHGESHSGTDLASKFTDYFVLYYDPIHDQMRYIKDNIEGLYEGVPADAPSS